MHRFLKIYCTLRCIARVRFCLSGLDDRHIAYSDCLLVSSVGAGRRRVVARRFVKSPSGRLVERRVSAEPPRRRRATRHRPPRARRSPAHTRRSHQKTFLTPTPCFISLYCFSRSYSSVEFARSDVYLKYRFQIHSPKTYEN